MMNTVGYKLNYLYFDPEGRIEIWFYKPECDCILIDASVVDFDRFMPGIEGDFQDGNGKYTARFDKFGNLHWLVEDFDGHISYNAKNCNNIIDELIKVKLNG